MPARSILEIILRLKGDQAKKELKEVDKGFSKVDKAAKESAKRVGDFGSGFLKMGAVIGGMTAGVIATGKAIYEMGKQGAAVIQTGESFDFLIQKVGLAPDILDQLRKASRGTIDDMTLMSSTATLLAGASDELSQELGNATPKLLEIAKAANKLNPSLGTTAQQYTSLATGIKRASPLILDNLGLTISISQSHEDYAEAIGKTVEQLTEEEKKIALLNATLEAGDNLIAQVGGTTESAADDFARMETNVTNLKNEILKGFSPAIADVTEKAADFITVLVDQNKVLEIIAQAEKDQILTREEAKRVSDDYLLGLIDEERVMLRLENTTRNWQAEMGLLDHQIVELEGHERAHVLQMEGEKAAMDDLIESTEDIEEATKNYKRELSDLQLFIRGPLGNEHEKFEERQKDLKDEMQKVKKEIFIMQGLDYLTEEQKNQLDEAKGKYDELSQKYDENATEHEKATKRIMFDLLSQRAAIDGLSQKELDVLNQIALNWDLVDQATFDYVTNADKYFQILEDDSMETMGTIKWEMEKTLGFMVSETSVATQIIIDEFGNIKSSLEGLSGTYDIKIRTFYETFGKSEYKLPTPSGPKPPGGQHGLDMIVPPGFPNDTFPVLATSGERVTVTPKGQGAGGYTQNITQNFYDEGAAALGLAVVREAGRARLNSAMGR